MRVNLTRRITALEASLSDDGRDVLFWGMKGSVPMTDREIQQEIARLQANGAPANARFMPVRWQTFKEADQCA